MVDDGRITDAKSIIGLHADGPAIAVTPTRSTRRIVPTCRSRWRTCSPGSRSSGAGPPTRRGLPAGPAAYLAWLRERGRPLAEVSEDDLVDYVNELRGAGPGAGLGGPAAGAGPVAAPVPGRGGPHGDRSRRPTSSCRGAARAAEGAQRGGDPAPARRRRWATSRWCGATGRSSRCSTAPGCASRSWSGCRSPTSTSTTPCSERSARDRRSASCRSGGPALRALVAWLGPGGRPEVVPGAVGRAGVTPRPCSSTRGAGG